MRPRALIGQCNIWRRPGLQSTPWRGKKVKGLRGAAQGAPSCRHSAEGAGTAERHSTPGSRHHGSPRSKCIPVHDHSEHPQRPGWPASALKTIETGTERASKPISTPVGCEQMCREIIIQIPRWQLSTNIQQQQRLAGLVRALFALRFLFHFPFVVSKCQSQCFRHWRLACR